jgi:GntR family transcriptional regulator
MDKNAPRYIAIYHELKVAILSQKYPVGSFLPPEADLIRQYAVSRTTIRKAVGLLRDEQLVSVQQGRGTEIISSGSVPAAFGIQKFQKISKFDITNKFLVEGNYRTTTQSAIVDSIPAEIDVARILGIDIGTTVYRLQRVKMVNDMVFAYVTNYVPCDIAPELEQYNEKITNLYNFLYDKYGIRFSRGEETISTAISGFLESKLLNVKIGIPLLVLNRTAYYDKGILEYAKTIVRPDLVQLVISMEGPTDEE